MLRFCVATLSLFAITIAISLSSASAQVYRSYRVEHSWKTQHIQTTPEILSELAKERREERRIEEERKFLLQLQRERQQTTNPQTIYVHVPASQQGPTWAEYREVVKTLQETQKTLAELQAEIAQLNAQPARQSTRNVATTKVVSRQKQYRANPKYVKPASTQYVKSKSMRLIDDLREIGFPLDVAIKASLLALDSPNKSERAIIRRAILGHDKMSNGEKAKLWMLYTTRNK